MSGKKLRWGVIGTANIGRAVNPAIHASANGELIACASRDGARAKAYGEKWNIARCYGSYAALLDDPDIDAVYIPLPNGLHAEWSIKSAEQGKHVLCEKPLALSADECRSMQRAADANGVKLMEAFMYRFHPRTEAAIATARSGSLGALRAIRSTFTFKLSRANDIRLDPAQGGGAVMDVGCYCINVTRTIAGEEPTEVQAWARWTTSGVDAALSGAMRFDSGLVARFDCALDLERHEMFEVAGTDATMTVEESFVPRPSDTAIISRRAQREQTRDEIAWENQYQRMVEHFGDCALNNTPLRYTTTDAAANVAVIEALLKSARRNGVPVTVGA